MNTKHKIAIFFLFLIIFSSGFSVVALGEFEYYESRTFIEPKFETEFRVPVSFEVSEIHNSHYDYCFTYTADDGRCYNIFYQTYDLYPVVIGKGYGITSRIEVDTHNWYKMLQIWSPNAVQTDDYAKIPIGSKIYCVENTPLQIRVGMKYYDIVSFSTINNGVVHSFHIELSAPQEMSVQFNYILKNCKFKTPEATPSSEKKEKSEKLLFLDSILSYFDTTPLKFLGGALVGIVFTIGIAIYNWSHRGCIDKFSTIARGIFVSVLLVLYLLSLHFVFSSSLTKDDVFPLLYIVLFTILFPFYLWYCRNNKIYIEMEKENKIAKIQKIKIRKQRFANFFYSYVDMWKNPTDTKTNISRVDFMKAKIINIIAFASIFLFVIFVCWFFDEFLPYNSYDSYWEYLFEFNELHEWYIRFVAIYLLALFLSHLTVSKLYTARRLKSLGLTPWLALAPLSFFVGFSKSPLKLHNQEKTYTFKNACRTFFISLIPFVPLYFSVLRKVNDET